MFYFWQLPGIPIAAGLAGICMYATEICRLLFSQIAHVIDFQFSIFNFKVTLEEFHGSFSNAPYRDSIFKVKRFKFHYVAVTPKRLDVNP